MDCPHCHEENLLGARICASCGLSMISAPPRPPAGMGTAVAPHAPASFATPPAARPEALATGRDATGEVADAPRPAAIPVTRPVRSGGIRRTTDDFLAPLGCAAPAAPAAASSAPGPSSPSLATEEAPARRPGPSGPSGPRSGAAVHVLCRVCAAPFERPVDAKGAAICAACRDISGEASRGAATERAAPTTGEVAASREQASPTARARPVVLPRRRSSIGPAVLVVLAVAGLAAGALLWLRGPDDRAPDLLRDVRTVDASVGTDIAKGALFRQLATLTLHVVREESRVVTASVRAVDVHQTVEQECEAAFVEAAADGPVFDMAADTLVRQQSGRLGKDDASGADLFPWQGHHAVVRVRAASGSPPVRLDEAAVTPGAEVPPLFHLGALGARGVSFRQGDRWKARLTLPLAADRGGRALAVTLPADVEYEGVAVRSGIRCAAFRVRGTAPRELPPALREHYPQADGTLTGVVWVELATGVVVAADLDSTLRFAGTVEKTDETLTVTARLQIARR